ncbi:hypothetical protein ACFSKS_01870 [Pseudocitrobacter faecalis]
MSGGATLTRPTTAKPSCRCMVSGALRLPDLQRPNRHAGAWCRGRFAYPTYNGQTVMPVHGVGCATLTRPTTAKLSCRCMVSGALRLPDLQRPNHHAGAWCRGRFAYPTYNGQTIMSDERCRVALCLPVGRASVAPPA